MKISDLKELEEPIKNAIVFLIMFSAIALTICFASCKTVNVGSSHEKDSVRIEHRIDTFYRHTHDSIRIQLPCNDSIEYAFVERWHIDTIRSVSRMHDTISVCQTDTIYQPRDIVHEKVVNSPFAKFCIWFFWIVIVVALGVVGIRIYFRIMLGK